MPARGSAVGRLMAVLRDPAGDQVAQQAIRYLIVGGCGYLLAVALYALELEVGVPPYPAVAVVFVANGLFNFAAMRAWAFPDSGRGVGSELRRFCLVAGLSLVVNYATFALAYSVAGIAALPAQALAIVVAAPVGFVANRRLTFGRES